MPKTLKATEKKEKKPSLRKQVVEILDNALVELKANIGDKKFSKKIKKASKVLAAGIKTKNWKPVTNPPTPEKVIEG